jgi:hypothetical protein
MGHRRQRLPYTEQDNNLFNVFRVVLGTKTPKKCFDNFIIPDLPREASLYEER